MYFRGRVTHGNTNDGGCLNDSCRESAIILTVGKVQLAAYHVEKNVEAVRLGRVSRDDENKSDRVDRARLSHDRGFPGKTEGLARVAHSGLARPQAIGDEHYNACEKMARGGGLSEVSRSAGRKK
jgi:hypothetical protein